MGFSLSWIAVRTDSPETINESLALHSSGETRDAPAEAPCSATHLPNGWYVVFFNHKELGSGYLAPLSSRHAIIYGFVEEHVMYSTVARWEFGHEIWSVTHDAQDDLNDLTVQGSPPPAFETIFQRALDNQRRHPADEEPIDFLFDVPVQLAFELTGFRYDEDLMGAQNRYVVLEPHSKGSVWMRLKRRLLG